MAQFTQASGSTVCAMAREHNSGRMARVTMESGETIKQMVRASWYTPMVTSMKESGSTIKQKAKVPIHMQTEPTTKVNGLMTNSTGKELRVGQMAPDMMVSTSRERKKEKVD